LVLVFSGIGALSGGTNDTAPAATAAVATETTEEAVETEQDAEAVVEEEASAETVGQENARRSVESYLDYSAFSRSGLIEQLEFEGYTAQQAVYGVNQTGL
jgi:colicin import membrane protein